jgi:hypothetical protein
MECILILGKHHQIKLQIFSFNSILLRKSNIKIVIEEKFLIKVSSVKFPKANFRLKPSFP